MIRRSLIVAACAALSALGACHVHITAPTTDPLPDKFYYPAGLLLDPDGRLLYVSNGNADLRYRGGTLMAVDLQRFHCAVEAFPLLVADKQAHQGVASYVPTYTPSAECAVFGLTAADVLTQRDAKGTPTSGCVSDGTDPSVVDCIESSFILSNATVRVGNFAGTMRIRKPDPTSQQRTLYLAVRGDPSITYANLDLSQLAAAPDASGHIDKPGFLDCFDDPSTLLTRDGYDATTNTTTVPPRCDSSHLIQQYTCTDQLGCKIGDNDIPSEPFNMILEEGNHADGQPYSHIIVSHLAAGQATIINLLGTPYVSNVSPAFFAANRANQRGAFGLTKLGTGDDALYYMSSSLVPQIATFRVSELPQGDTIIPDNTVTFSGAFQSGTDGRALITDPNQPRMYFAENAPPQVAIIDTSYGHPGTGGEPYNRIESVVDICQEPSNMTLRQTLASDGKTFNSRLWVSCFLSDQLMIVDPDLQIVEETIITGRGPNELVFNFTDAETAAGSALAEPAHRYIYVAEYGQSTIAVIDADQSSPTANRVVARIGLPQPPPDYLTQH